MNKIGIISGGGSLPFSIGINLLDKGYGVCFFHIKNFSDPKLYKEYENVQIELSSLSKIFSSLKNKNINEIIMVGKISRPSIKDIQFDFKTLSIIKYLFLESKGDDKLLKSISKIFIKNGFPLFDWKKNCEDLFSFQDNLTLKKPSINDLANKKKGLEIFKIISDADIGQSLIIQNKLILGFECIEGTDELIKRCSLYKKNQDNGILMKLSKYQQHSQLDVPTIGLNTVQLIKKYNYEGIYIEKGNCIIINKKEVIDFCNNNNLFLSTTKKI